MVKFALPFLALFSLSACDGDSDDFTSGIDSSRELSTLDETEYSELCEAASVAVDVEDFLPLYCYYTSAFQAEDDSSIDCDDAAQECLANPPLDFSETSLECEAIRLSDLAGCSETVGTVEACASGQSSLYRAQSEGVNCDNAIERFEQIEQDSGSMSCQTLDEDCPDLFETEDNEV